MRLPTLALIAALTSSAAAHAQTRPAASEQVEQQLEQQRAAERSRVLMEADALPALPPQGVRAVLTLGVNDGGDLTATLGEHGAGEASVKLTDWPGVTTVSGNAAAAAGDPATQGRLAHMRFDRPGEVVEQTEVLATAFSLQIVRDAETLDGVRSVSLLQAPQMADNPDAVITLRVTDSSAAGAPGRGQAEALTARSFVELRRKYPNEVQRYLRPLFADLGAAILLDPDPKSAWQVLGPLAADDPAADRKVSAVLAALDADDFAARTRARRTLADLGQPAAVALSKWKAPFASAEQRAAVDAFLAAYRPLPPAQVERLRGDKKFLFDVFAGEDQTLSALALIQLRKATGEALPFDESLDGPARAKAIADLRDRVQP